MVGLEAPLGPSAQQGHPGPYPGRSWEPPRLRTASLSNLCCLTLQVKMCLLVFGGNLCLLLSPFLDVPVISSCNLPSTVDFSFAWIPAKGSFPFEKEKENTAFLGGFSFFFSSLLFIFITQSCSPDLSSVPVWPSLLFPVTSYVTVVLSSSTERKSRSSGNRISSLSLGSCGEGVIRDVMTTPPSAELPAAP